MNKQFIFVLVAGLLLPMNTFGQSVLSKGDASSNTSALLTRHQQRMDILEQGQEIRGVVEKDLRTIKLGLNNLELVRRMRVLLKSQI